MENDLIYENEEQRPLYSQQRILPPQVEPDKEQRVKIWMGWLLCVAALVVDIVEIGLFYMGDGFLIGLIGEIVAIAASFVFWVWFLILGVTYSSNTKRFLTSIAMHIVELIPGADAIPFWFFWTLGMLLIITLTRMEDRGQEPTILGALGRLAVWTTPVTIVGALPFQKYKDIKRKKKQRKEKEKEAIEIAENPEEEERVREKYAKRAHKSKIKELNPAERLERRFFKINRDGVELREGKNIDDLKNQIGKLDKKISSKIQNTGGNNLLNLRK